MAKMNTVEQVRTGFAPYLAVKLYNRIGRILLPNAYKIPRSAGFFYPRVKVTITGIYYAYFPDFRIFAG